MFCNFTSSDIKCKTFANNIDNVLNMVIEKLYSVVLYSNKGWPDGKDIHSFRYNLNLSRINHVAGRILFYSYNWPKKQILKVWRWTEWVDLLIPHLPKLLAQSNQQQLHQISVNDWFETLSKFLN